jgi:AraC family transcriptional regulator
MATTNAIRREYIGRINKVMDYIENNLEKELSLVRISKIACFSPFHFHRIFSAITGETINVFINRKRIESIAAQLFRETETPMSELADKYGFSSPATFSRAFKKFYGISPSEFKENRKDQFSKIRKVQSKDGKEIVTFDQYVCSVNNIKNWIKMNAQIEVKEMPEVKLVYMKHLGSFDQIGQVYEKLFRWAGPKGIFGPNVKTITVYHDDPKVTEISKVRQSAGITIDRDIKVDGEVNLMTVPQDKYAVGRFEIGVMEFEQAWESMCVWVADNGYSNKDGDYYELYHNDHMQHPERKFILDICIPVE